jgi:diaminopimelate decarboxylase
VYSANTIRARWQRLDQAFASVPHRIHFAMKANSNLGVLRLLQELGAGVDIVSGGELFRAREAGFIGRDVVFSGVGKTVREIEQALDERVLLINVESEAELVTIDAVASRHGVVAPIAIRVNPEVTVDSPHAYIKTGEKGQKFGIPRDDVSRLVSMIHELPHVALRGLGMHLGSQIGNADPMRDALPHLFDASPNLLYQLVTLVSPVELRVRGAARGLLCLRAGGQGFLGAGLAGAGLEGSWGTGGGWLALGLALPSGSGCQGLQLE